MRPHPTLLLLVATSLSAQNPEQDPYYHHYPVTITRPISAVGNFGAQRRPTSSGNVRTHNALDLVAPMNAPIRAPFQAGMVIASHWMRGYGNGVIIQDEGGYYHLFAHANTVFVKTGELVSSGEIIGTVGKSGIRNKKKSLPHLHWEVYIPSSNPQKISGTYRLRHAIDPRDWLRQSIK